MAHAFFLVVRFALALWCSCAGAGYGVMGLRAAVRGAALRSVLSVLRRESCINQRQETLSPLAQTSRIDAKERYELASEALAAQG